MGPMKSSLPFILGATLFLRVEQIRAEPPRTLADIRVFAVYEPVLTPRDVDILSRVQPDFICRGWFKWGSTPDWQAVAPLAQACREKDILLQGGITLAALYPGENGIDDSTFRDFACHATDGTPYLCGPSVQAGWYHLSLYNPKVIDYLKNQSRLQIDAGACGIWYDEVEGYYDWNATEGYDAYACAAFRDWLIRKFCVGQGWREDDPRWQTRFGIDLARHGGSIRTFDYLRHLQTTPGKGGRPLAADPPQGNPGEWATSANPLYREWGYAWDRKAQGTFRFDTAAATFADLLADANRYAREKYGRTLINTYNHNGTARPGAAFLQPHNGAQPPLNQNRLDGRGSFLPFYESVIRDAAEVSPAQPVVFFVDWPGETDRLTALPRADQTHFFSLYIPEAYAAGGEFALPLRGYSYVAADQGTLGSLARMADFYREYAPWLRGARPLPNPQKTPDKLAVRVRSAAGGTVVHLINHAFSRRDVWPLPRTNLCVTLAWSGPAPAGAFAVSPDFPEQRPVPLALNDGCLTFTVGSLICSALVVLPDAGVLHPLVGHASTGTHILATNGRALAVAKEGRFTLWLPPEDRGEPQGRPQWIECLETGERLPARDGIAFAEPPADDFASGLVLDAFGIPVRHAEIAGNGHRWHTDAWGRFRVPLAKEPDGPFRVCVEPGSTHPLALTPVFTARRFSAARRPILSLQQPKGGPSRGPSAVPDTASLGGFWPNWSDKERTPGVITLACEEHLGQTALRCLFSPAPHVAWQNVNSPPFPLANADAVELVYAGDGSPRTVNAILFAPQLRDRPAFYRCPLPLDTHEWTRKRIALAEFRDDKGAPFDPAAVPGNISLQFAPADSAETPATLWVHEVSLVNDTPVEEAWRSGAAFDAVDVDNLMAGHKPQPPPPVVASRLPLVRFADAPVGLQANWEGKSAPEAKSMVVIERVSPADGASFLRVSFCPGECLWGNANVPLNPDALRGQDGLVLRLHTQPSDETLTLALHVMPHSGDQSFYVTTCEADEGCGELVLPWSDFHRSDGQPFQPIKDAAIHFQICRPPQALTRETVIELEQIDAFARPKQGQNGV